MQDTENFLFYMYNGWCTYVNATTITCRFKCTSLPYMLGWTNSKLAASWLAIALFCNKRPPICDFFYPNLKDVTPQNFLSIMKGDKEAMKGIGSGKVIDRWARFIAAEINNLGILAFSKAFQGRKTKWNFKWKQPCIRSIKFVFVCFLTRLMVNFKF